MVENGQILDELLSQAEVLYRDDRIAMEEAKSEQIRTIEAGERLVENTISGRADREERQLVKSRAARSVFSSGAGLTCSPL